jgi:O-phosphoseryl-tRNA(Cys) synthetase
VEESDRSVLEGYFPAFCVSSEEAHDLCHHDIWVCENTLRVFGNEIFWPKKDKWGKKYGTRKFVVYAGDVMCCT